nr:hypothetical protein [uncultured Porphyromonas sp.]
MQCCNQDTSALPRVRRGNDHPFTLVIRSSPEGYDLGEGKGEQLNPEELQELRVTIYEPNFGEGFNPEIRYFGNALGFELSSRHTKQYGLGIYQAEVSFALNGSEEHTLRRPLCRVVREDEEVARHNNTLVLELAPIAKGDKGDRGQSAYEAYLDTTDDDPKMSEAEWIASLKSATDKLQEAKAYTEEVAREGYRGRLTKYAFDLTDKGRNMWFAVAVIYAEGQDDPKPSWVGKVITIRASCPRAYLEWETFPYSNEGVALSEDVVTTRVTRQAMLSYSASSHISKPKGGDGEGFRYESVYLRGGELWTVSVWAEGGVRVLGMKDYRTAEYEELNRIRWHNANNYQPGAYAYLPIEGYTEPLWLAPSEYIGETDKAVTLWDSIVEDVRKTATRTLEGAKTYAKSCAQEVRGEVSLLAEKVATKAQSFLSDTCPVSYKAGDLWTLTADWTTHKRGTALIAVKDSRAGIYSPEDWVELYKYAQMIEEAKRWNIHTHTFDLTQLDSNKYYAAVIQLPMSVNINQPDRYNIVLYAGLDRNIPVPPYATHTIGFSAELRWSVSAPGNGARYDGRVVESFGTSSVKAGELVMSQPYHSAPLRSEYVYLRGGYVYQCRVTSDFPPTFSLAATDFTLAGRSAVIPSPVESITPPKSDVERLRDDMREGDRATLEGAKNAATAKAKEAVDALQLGGVQLLRSPWSTAERVQDGGLYDVRFADKSGKKYELPTGTYTLSGELEVTRQGNGLMLLPTPYNEVFKDHPSERAVQTTPHTGGRFALTFTVTSSFDGFYLYPNRSWAPAGAATSGAGIFRRLKLERGNKPSDWSLAPEDVDDKIDKLRTTTESTIAALVQRVAALEAARQA